MDYEHTCNAGDPGFDSTPKYFFKSGVHGLWPRAPGFLKLLWFAHWYAYVCVRVCVCVCVSACVSAPKAINNQWRDMVLYRPCAIG